MLPPTLCDSDGALGITDSPEHPSAALLWLQELSDGSTVRTAGYAALGRLQLSPLQALQWHFPDPPRQGRKGH